MESSSPLLVNKHENLLFGISIIISIVIVINLLFSIIGALLLAGFFILSLLSHIISMSYIQLNGVLLRENQFPDLFEKVQDISTHMELKHIPEVYLVESGGILNAFATKVLGYFGKNMVVLYSDFVDISYESDSFDIDYVIAHELAHLKRNHIVKSLFILPALWVPFVGTSYLRMAEYTCDRMAAYYTGRPRNAINGLLVLAAGKRLFKKMNLEAYLMQYNEKSGLWVTIAELLSTHPPIPKRIHAIETFMLEHTSAPLRTRTKQIIIICSTLFILIPVILIGMAFAAVKITEEWNFLGGLFEEEYAPLLDAAWNDEDDRAVELLIEGADPNELSEYGESALTIAIEYDNADLVPILLEYGADPNLQNDYGWTPLMSAIMMEDIESVQLLLDAGADPTLTDSEGMSSVDFARDMGVRDV